MRVHLRARDRRVAEHLLHRAQVTRRLQYVRRERVAQHVRMHVPGQPLLDRPRSETAFDRARRQPPARCANEQRIVPGEQIRVFLKQDGTIERYENAGIREPRKN